MSGESPSTKPVILDRQRIGVIGLGDGGLTEAVEFARAGFSVTGFEINEEHVQSVRAGRSYVVDVSSEELGAMVASSARQATADFDRLAGMDLEQTIADGTREPLFLAPHDIIFVPRTRIANANLWVKQHIVDLLPFRLAPPIP